jgi:mono/diheme cytochrome c family protein
LNRTNVNPATFGQLAAIPVDGLVYAQPLYMENVSVPGTGAMNLVFVETENDSVYAFNATTLSETPVWKRSFLGDSVLGCNNCSTFTSTGVNAPNVYPQQGITATPVIDPSTNTMYLIASTVENGTYYHKLHALDITTGAERSGSPVVITGTGPGGGFGSVNGELSFHAQFQLSRSGLALNNGVLYIAFSSQNDQETIGGVTSGVHGWLFSYNASNLQQTASFITSPASGCSDIWMSGDAPAIDNAGNIYVSTGNDDQNAPTLMDYGNSFLKFTPNLVLSDWFTPFNSLALSTADVDVGSGGLLLVPPQAGSSTNLLIGGGKEGTIYVTNQDDMGHMNTATGATSDTNIVQEISGVLPVGKNCCVGIYGTPAYYQGKVFIAAAGDYLRSFPIVNGLLNTATMQSANEEIAIRGATPVISANGDSNGIVWILNGSAYTYSASGKPVTNGPAVLMAYSTDDLSSPLYRSDRVPADAAGYAVKYANPMVANGMVFVGGQGNGQYLAGNVASGTTGNGQLTVYGLIPNRTVPIATGTVPPSKLSETGFFSNLGTLTPAAGVIEYDVNAPLWSDGSGKGRWLVLPSGGKITFNTTQPWTFPVGTQTIKQFDLPLGNGEVTHLETRVMTLGSNGWTGVTYQWTPIGAPSSEQTDALLLSKADTETITITNSSGGTSTQSWYFPSPTDCLTCHTSANGGVLGINTRQLNRTADSSNSASNFPTIPSGPVDSWIGSSSSWVSNWSPNPSNANATVCGAAAAASGSQNQLDIWNAAGYFTKNIGAASQCDAYANDADPTSSPEKRARSYLAVNCAVCHSPHGTAAVTIDFSYDTALNSMNVVNVIPATGNVGVDGALLLTPGNSSESVMYLRMDTTNNTYRMPTLASSVIDTTGSGVVGYWIDNMNPASPSVVTHSQFVDWMPHH